MKYIFLPVHHPHCVPAAMSARSELRGRNGKALSDDSLFFIALCMQRLQYLRGVQFIVSKKVSDELRDSDIMDIPIERIPIPHYTIDICWEDQSIPEILFNYRDDEWVRESTKFLGDYIDLSTKADGAIQFSYCKKETENPEGVMVTSIVARDHSDEWVRGAIEIPDLSGPDENTTQDEKSYTRFLYAMMLKLFLYASLRTEAKEPIKRSEITRREGSKPGLHGRPVRPVFRIRLPPHEHIYEREYSTPTGRKVRPHRRRGHFRLLEAERFKNKKGSIVYVRPSIIHRDEMPVLQQYVIDKGDKP